MNSSFRRTGRCFESLETRRLLAVDLVVEHDPFPDAVPGTEVTRIIRVHNLGDEIAEGTYIGSSLSDELVDPVWERHVARAKFIGDPTGGREPDFEITQQSGRDTFVGVGIEPIGDLNGDGLEDHILHREVQPSNVRWWRPTDSLILFGSLDANINLAAPDGQSVIIAGSANRTDWSKIEKLGDVNGDGFDDLFLEGNIVWGRADIGETEQLEVSSLSVGERVPVTARNAFGIGDLNNDGFDDFAVSNAVVFGGAHLTGRVTTIKTDELDSTRAFQLACELGCDFFHAGPAGDFNGDGLHDVAFGIANQGAIVLYGFSGVGETEVVNADSLGDRGFLIPVQRNSSGFLGFSVTSGNGGYGMRFGGASDFDEDGFDDLLITILGDDCFNTCTAGDKDNIDSSGGAVVVFGGDNVANEGRFDQTNGRVLRLETTFNHDDRRPVANIRDINFDGRADVFLTTESANYVILDVDSVMDTDLGFGGSRWTEQSRAFNGENGFGIAGGDLLRRDVISGQRGYVDINQDGLVDEIIFQRETAQVYLSRPTETLITPGANDINDVLDIQPGTSVVYTVRGTLRDDAVPPRSTAVAIDSNEDLRDNVADTDRAISLAVNASLPTELTPGEELLFNVTLTNSGADTATNVRFREDLLSQLEEVTWSRTDTLFPANMDVGLLNGVDGATFTGPDRVYTERSKSPGYDSPLIAGLGVSVGSFGDTDGDGFDEIYGVGSPLESQFPIIDGLRFAGSSDFGDGGTFRPVVGEAASMSSVPDEQPPTGDFNGDGFADRFVADAFVEYPFAGEDGRGETLVIFGTSDGIPEIAKESLDGQNGFVITGISQGDLSGRNVAVGDVNNDGRDDIIISRGLVESCPRGECGVEGPTGGSTPAVYVVYGAATSSAAFSLADLDGRNGFQIETLSAQTSVASDFDVNGDGIDDILIGDVFAGVAVHWQSPELHGGMYVVFGRQSSAASGSGSINDFVNIPIGGSVTYEVRATVPAEAKGLIAGTISVAADDHQIELDPRNDSILLEARIAMPPVNVLEAGSNFGTEQSTTDVDIADLDGDGDLDIFESVTGSVDLVWLNDGSGNLTSTETGLDVHQSIYSALGDIDGDGDIDAVTATYDLGVVLALNDATGNFTHDYRLSQEPAGTDSAPYQSHDVALADLDGDGDLDLFVAGFLEPNLDTGGTRNGVNRVYRNDGNGNFAEINHDIADQFQSTSVELGDIDGDGDIDAVTSSRTVPGSRIWINDGSGRFGDSGSELNAAEHHTLFDADGDGDLDLIGAEDGANRVSLNDGQGNFAQGNRLGEALTSHFAAADFDADGDVDLLAANWRDDGNEVWLNDGLGNFQPQPTSLDVPARTDHVAVGDLDGDGDLDAVAGIAGGANRIYINSLPRPQLDADLTGDGSVGFDDFLLLSLNFGKTDASREEGDIDGDGVVAFSDFLLLSRDFGKTSNLAST